MKTEDEEVFSYSLEIILSTVFNFIAIIIISIITKTFLETLVYLSGFIPLKNSTVYLPSKSTSVIKDDNEQNAYINITSSDEYSKKSYLVVYDTKKKEFATEGRYVNSTGNKKEPYTLLKGVATRKYQLWGYTGSHLVTVKGIWCP